jgi:hypothetical protein
VSRATATTASPSAHSPTTECSTSAASNTARMSTAADGSRLLHHDVFKDPLGFASARQTVTRQTCVNRGDARSRPPITNRAPSERPRTVFDPKSSTPGRPAAHYRISPPILGCGHGRFVDGYMNGSMPACHDVHSRNRVGLDIAVPLPQRCGGTVSDPAGTKRRRDLTPRSARTSATCSPRGMT